MYFRRLFLLREITVAFGVVLSGAVLFLAGCDQAAVTSETPQDDSSPLPETSSEDDEPLPPDVRLRMQYDQTEVTYSNVWPGIIVGNNPKRRNAKTEGAKLMTEFERTHEVRSYDDEGYLSRSYNYLNGNRPHMNMPAEAYEDLKSEMPYNPADQNPVVRFELDGGTMRYIRRDGTVAHKATVDPEKYRVDPAQLDSLSEMENETTDTSHRRDAVLESLRQQGLSLTQIDQNRVSFTQSLEQDEGVDRVKTVFDLRFGKPIYLKYLLEDGKTDMVVTRRYIRKSGVAIMRKSVTYNYDDRTGDWGVVSKTEVTRNDISVKFNE